MQAWFILASAKKYEKIEMSGRIPLHLYSAIANIYIPAGMKLTENPKREVENDEYEGFTFKLDDRNITFRIGKITPERPGNFVAIYDRVDRTIIPVDTSYRKIDFLVVDVSDKVSANRGQFVFPRSTLLSKGIISQGLSTEERLRRKKGKLSFRVFPPWAKPKPTALKTQEWQNKFFFSISKDNMSNFSLVRRLFLKT
ncbi:MAG: MepB family protein [Candidatus Neptunochlamydia sp.]|nr:MepB family protein [Candidatus Neptunochlamydia sp.]